MGLVAFHGQLRVSGNRIVDAQGRDFVLRGVSLFWSQWMPQFYNPKVVSWLRQDWGANVVRASLAVHHDGYLDYPAREAAKISTIVEAAIAEDIYVIVDWHAHLREEEEAVAFFAAMARRYGCYPNVIFETWNEPDARYAWSADIRPYHEAVIAAIRQHAPHSLIIVGTENFSQRVDVAARHPVIDGNIAYTLHFYAASHREKLRQRVQDALSEGVALLATEYGTCEANGDGFFAPQETLKWLYFLETVGIGSLNWAISDKAETAAALRPGAAGEGGWKVEQLTPSGRLVRNYLREWRKLEAGDASRTGMA
jgi:endoglucanase